ncbi:uncharacterized protein LOC119112847 [Pollicipes pollicipes]|uniref:uncharacterized protein LOC119112847 n=1 Tax=Pollicipes pollicipes TaxID=41117 RepID=UPI0018857E81|nr:uncharacterized protein LOC119112847 [Pollicipes pollicipes]
MPPRTEGDECYRRGPLMGQPYQEMEFGLPLICCHGHPTTLDNMPQRSLVAFVTFMMRCALCLDEAVLRVARHFVRKALDERHAHSLSSDTLEKCTPEQLRQLVRCCYRASSCQLLVSLSATLERQYQRGQLRLRSNGDGTSSLCERATGRPVVTCRDDDLVRGLGPARPRLDAHCMSVVAS